MFIDTRRFREDEPGREWDEDPADDNIFSIYKRDMDKEKKLEEEKTIRLPT